MVAMVKTGESIEEFGPEISATVSVDEGGEGMLESAWGCTDAAISVLAQLLAPDYRC